MSYNVAEPLWTSQARSCIEVQPGHKTYLANKGFDPFQDPVSHFLTPLVAIFGVAVC